MSLEAFATRQVTRQKGFEFLRQNISTADKPTPSRLLTVIAKDKRRKKLCMCTELKVKKRERQSGARSVM